ncbi:hypothetical protein ACEQPO_13430 [Bacillus sp. SL00103]
MFTWSKKEFSSSIIKEGRKCTQINLKWKKEADERILEHRQRDLEINVTNHDKSQ